MKRRIVTVLIFLLLGAIVNIAVAWACALMKANPYLRNAAGTGSGEGIEWPIGTLDDPTTHTAHSWVFDFGTRHDHALRQERDKSNPRLAWEVTRDQAGWPCLSLGAIKWWHYSETTVIHESQDWRAGIPMQRLQDAATVLPLVPMWRGFAINTLFYAAILWLVFSARLLLPRYRRQRRIKRGLCPACAYPVGASDLCAECGNKLNITSKIAARERMGLPPPATPASEAERTT